MQKIQGGYVVGLGAGVGVGEMLTQPTAISISFTRRN